MALGYYYEHDYNSLAFVPNLSAKEWANPDSNEAKMSVWNSYIGKHIADSVIAELKHKFGSDTTSAEYRDEAQYLIERYSKSAIESGVAIKSADDPRLQFMDDLTRFNDNLANLQWNTSDLVRIIESTGGTNIMNIIKNNRPGGASYKLDMVEMMDNIMTKWEHGGDDFTDIHDNDKPTSTYKSYGFGSKDSAHRYLQIVDWAESSHTGTPNTDVCDPNGDPIVDSDGKRLPDKLDTDPELGRTVVIPHVYTATRDWEEYEAINPKEERKLSKLPVVSAIAYQQWPDPHASAPEYSIVFKELKGEDQANFQKILEAKDIKAFAEYYLNPAFEIYQQLIKDGVDPSTIKFLGYDEGGAAWSLNENAKVAVNGIY